MSMFTLCIVFHRNEEFHDDIISVDTEEIVNEIVEQLEETDGAQQQVWSVRVNGWLYSLCCNEKWQKGVIWPSEYWSTKVQK